MRKAALNAVFALAKQDDRVLYMGSDLGAGTQDIFRETFPERFFMEGVAEQNLIGMAAGLAMDGFIPYVNTIAPFFVRRALEQIAIDLCLHNLPVRLLGNGGGLVYAPLGPTHLAPDDIAILRVLPNMTILAPADAPQMAALVKETLDWPGPLYIRLARGGDPIVWSPELPVKIGKSLLLRQGDHAVFLTTGMMAHHALTAAESLRQQGIQCAVRHFHTIKPLDDAVVLADADHFPLLITLEEHSRIGGLGSAVAELLADVGPHPGPKLLRLALPDQFFSSYGSQDELLAQAGLHPETIVRTVAHHLSGS